MSNKLCSFVALILFASAIEVFSQSEGDPVPPPPPPPPLKSDAQQQESPCPQLAIQSQLRTIREGQPLVFTARINGGDKSVIPSILWNLSAGVIEDGQGTQRITVDTVGSGAYREIVAEVWLGGYAPECQAQSQPFRVAIVPPAAKFAEFGEVSIEDEKDRIAAAVSVALQANDKLYVIGYAGRNSPRMYASTALRRMRDQILKSGMQAAKIGAYDGGFREQPAFEFWIVPEGAEPPQATPTIDRKDIVYPPVTRTTRGTTRRP